MQQMMGLTDRLRTPCSTFIRSVRRHAGPGVPAPVSARVEVEWASSWPPTYRVPGCTETTCWRPPRPWCPPSKLIDTRIKLADQDLRFIADNASAAGFVLGAARNCRRPILTSRAMRS